FFSSRRRHTRFSRDWSSDVCSSDLWETLRTLEKLGITLFGTDVHGTVRVATDGRDLAVFVERVPEGLGAPYWTGPESPGAQPGAKPGAQSAADRAGEPVAGFVLAGGARGATGPSARLAAGKIGRAHV